MKRLMNYLRGMVMVTVTGMFPERLINLCAQADVDFWALTWVDDHTICFTTRRRTMGRLRRAAERADCTVTISGSRGLPDVILRFRTRYTFLLGLFLCLVAVGFLSRFILTIDVTGNERVPTAQILSELRRLGVRPGVYGPGVERQHVAQELLAGMDELSFAAINRHGTRLEVIVRERLLEPEMRDRDGFYDIVAEADGVVVHMEVEAGEYAVEEGAIVAAGDLLISGTMVMEPPKYSGLPVRTYSTHARGRVWARTWRSLEAQIPVTAPVKRWTGEEKTVWTLELLGRRFTLWNRCDAEKTWDSQEQVWQAKIPGGTALPLLLRRDTRRAYERGEAQVELNAAQTLLEEHLKDRLRSLIGEDGTVENIQFDARIQDGQLRVTLEAECQEEIGREVPGTPFVPDLPEES